MNGESNGHLFLEFIVNVRNRVIFDINWMKMTWKIIEETMR
jgi:hypothetical protein